MEKCILRQSIAYSMQNFDIFCPSVPAMVCIWAKRKLVKFYGYFSQHNFEKLIWILETAGQSVSGQYLKIFERLFNSQFHHFHNCLLSVRYLTWWIMCIRVAFHSTWVSAIFWFILRRSSIFLDIQILWQDLAAMSLI